jgi:hypothetical protein
LSFDGWRHGECTILTADVADVPANLDQSGTTRAAVDYHIPETAFSE